MTKPGVMKKFTYKEFRCSTNKKNPFHLCLILPHECGIFAFYSMAFLLDKLREHFAQGWSPAAKLDMDALAAIPRQIIELVGRQVAYIFLLHNKLPKAAEWSSFDNMGGLSVDFYSYSNHVFKKYEEHLSTNIFK